MPVAGRTGTTLDRSALRDRERPGIALVAICVVRDRQQWFGRRHHDVGDAVVRVLAEVGVKEVAAIGEDRADDLAAPRVKRRSVDRCVPRAVGGEHRAPADRRTTHRPQPAGGSECGRGPVDVGGSRSRCRRRRTEKQDRAGGNREAGSWHHRLPSPCVSPTIDITPTLRVASASRPVTERPVRWRARRAISVLAVTFAQGRVRTWNTRASTRP